MCYVNVQNNGTVYVLCRHNKQCQRITLEGFSYFRSWVIPINFSFIKIMAENVRMRSYVEHVHEILIRHLKLSMNVLIFSYLSEIVLSFKETLAQDFSSLIFNQTYLVL